MNRFYRSIRMLFAVLTVAAALGAGAFSASAQPLPWNPSCNTATIFNCTPCQVVLNLWTNPPGAVPGVAVPPFGSVLIPTPALPLTINGVFSQTGAPVPMIQPVPAAVQLCNCGLPGIPVAANGWIASTVVGPQGCCVDIYFNVNADPFNPCTILICPSKILPCQNR